MAGLAVVTDANDIGGFSYADYPRCGAIAGCSPIRRIAGVRRAS